MLYAQLDGVLRHVQAFPQELYVPDSQGDGLAPPSSAEGEGEHQGTMFSGLFGQPVNFIRRQVDVAAGRLAGKIPDGPRGSAEG